MTKSKIMFICGYTFVVSFNLLYLPHFNIGYIIIIKTESIKRYCKIDRRF